MKAGPKALLDGGVKGLAGKGKLASDKEIMVEGNPGREVQAELLGLQMNIRIVLVKNRMYQLIAAGKPGTFSEKEIRTFFDSFKLAK
jgi:hypothetical protein